MPQENLALEVKKQSSFDASVKNIRKALEDGDGKVDHKFRGPDKGVVFLKSIPYGFFEDEIRKYFKQFGKVTRVRVARSRKTGNSKGFAYVEFEHPEVAQVAAETMDNYLMFNKIMQAKYIPPEEQKFDYFKGVVKGKVPKDRNRKKNIEGCNRNLNSVERKLYCRSASFKLKQKMEKLQAMGIDYECKSVMKCSQADLEKAGLNKPVLTIDESDDEVTFKIPKNVSVIRKKSTSKKNATSEEIAKTSTENNTIIRSLVTESSSTSERTQKEKHRREMKQTLHNDDSIGDSVKQSKSASTLQVQDKTVKRKSNIGEFECVDSPKLKKTPKKSEAKSVKTVSSGWKVDDCS